MEPEGGGIVFPEMPGPEQAQAVIDTEKACHAKEPKEGDRVYLISNKWFTAWCQYSGFAYDPGRQRASVKPQQQPGPRPGPVDNADLVADPGAAAPGRPDLTSEELAAVVRLADDKRLEKKDFWPVFEPTWNLFKEWYGVAGPEVFRTFMQVGPARRLETDPRPMVFKAVLEEGAEGGNAGVAPDAEGPALPRKRSAVVDANQQCTVSDLKRRCCAALGVSTEDVHIWDYHGQNTPTELESKLHKTLAGVNLSDMQAVLLRSKDAQQEEDEPMPLPSSGSPLRLALSPRMGTSPACGSPLSRSFGRLPMNMEDSITSQPGRPRGLAGLGNLGNTCFMNSSLQCLLHSGPLMETFLSGRYRADLNTTNPLGLGGKLASSFSGLMSKVWAGGVSHVTPRAFKWRLARFAPQFSGYAQQDSQELLAFLLDGLHEDLNRIQDKPYVEEKDGEGRPDAELAAEAWANYRARNDSVVVDHFQGMYKSTLVCPTCSYRSVKFDPFMYLTLPLPSAKTRTLELALVAVDGSAAPEKYAITVPKSAPLRDAVRALGALCGLADPDAADAQLLLAQWTPSAGRLELFDDLDAKVAGIKEPRPSGFFNSAPRSVLLAYRYPSPEEGPRGGGRLTFVYHRLGYSSTLPAMALYLSQEQVAALTVSPASGSNKDYPIASVDPAVAAAAAAAEAEAAGASAMAEEGDTAAAEPAAAAAPLAGLPELTLEGAILRMLQPFRKAGPAAAPPAAATAAAEPLSELPPLEPLAPAEPEAAHGGALRMDLEDDDEDAAALAEPATPPRSDLDASPSTSGSDVAMESAPPLVPPPLLQPAGPSDGPVAFNIWKRQEEMAAEAAAADTGSESMLLDLPQQQQQQQQQEQEQEPAAAAEAADGSDADAAGPPFVLKLANDNGQAKRSFGLSSDPLPVLPSSGPLHIVADWSEGSIDAVEQYDRTLLEKPRLHASAAALASGAAAAAKPMTLEDCMECFLQPEQLEPEESWYCPKCKEHVQAVKKLDLWSLPEVLVVHLKRFSHTRHTRDKLDTPISFPFHGLDLSGYLGQEAVAAAGAGAASAPRYDLYAVSNHFGGMGGGHYTAYCQMPDGQWATFDDASARAMDAAGVQSPAAYLLFYRRQGAQVDLDAIVAGASSAPDGDAAAAADGDATPRAADAGEVSSPQALLTSHSTGQNETLFELD